MAITATGMLAQPVDRLRNLLASSTALQAALGVDDYATQNRKSFYLRPTICRPRK